MSEGERLLGLGPKMLVSVVFSCLLIAIVVGKWGQIVELSHGDIHVDMSGNITKRNQAPTRESDEPTRPKLEPAQNSTPLSAEPAQKLIEQLLALQLSGNLTNSSADEASLQMLSAIYRSPQQWNALMTVMDPQERAFLRVMEPMLKARAGGR